MTGTVTYQQRYVGPAIALCRVCAARNAQHLGPVQHGQHDELCQSCELGEWESGYDYVERGRDERYPTTGRGLPPKIQS